MAELFLEFFSEEIPARMQLKAAQDLKSHMKAALTALTIDFGEVETYITPRRLVCVVNELATQTKELKKERRGPRLGAPQTALTGFLKTLGEEKNQCIQKGDYWYAEVIEQSQPIEIIIPNLVRQLIRGFSWRKSMRWPGATLSWVRPVRSILCLLGGKPLTFEVPEFGLITSNKTFGHRFLSLHEFEVHSFADYRQKLTQTYVILDHADRQQRIEEGLRVLAEQNNCRLEQDKELLIEVAGLTEYPQPLIGEMKREFLRLPKAVLSTSMRVHQKYFTFIDAQGNIAPYFGFVANTIPKDEGREMLRGYERVLRARLSDAAFFYDQDCQMTLEVLVPKLDKIIFHKKLGTVGQRVQRLITLVDSPEAKRAAFLCKADLVSHMVGEFPELQGVMGGIYVRVQGESESVSKAIESHYQPLGSQDICPRDPVTLELALADKIDLLVGFFSIGETPTGSKDPFALRRAAIGIIRLIRENKLKEYHLRSKLEKAYLLYQEQGVTFVKDFKIDQVIDFITERLCYALRLEGIRPDCMATVLESSHTDEDLCTLIDHILSLNQFLLSDSGVSFQIAFRRAQGILTKNPIDLSNHHLREEKLTDLAEKTLFFELEKLTHQIPLLRQSGRYFDLMQLLSGYHSVIDNFLTLKINDDEESVRLNRFALLKKLVDQILKVIDFNRLEGNP